MFTYHPWWLAFEVSPDMERSVRSHLVREVIVVIPEPRSKLRTTKFAFKVVLGDVEVHSEVLAVIDVTKLAQSFVLKSLVRLLAWPM